jgi:hypothetical protein
LPTARALKTRYASVPGFNDDTGGRQPSIEPFLPAE